VTKAAERACLYAAGLATHTGRRTAVTVLYAEAGLDRRDNVRNRLLRAIAVAAPVVIPLPTDSRGISDYGPLELDRICDSMFGIRSWRTT
jgi:hypothetical protein